MSDPNFFILYVDKPQESARFYAALIGREPVESSPTFAMFALKSGVMLGLWSRHTVQPPADGIPAAGEMAFSLGSEALVTSAYEQWKASGLRILQVPTTLDFGHTFVALDPDGHRLRVFAPNA